MNSKVSPADEMRKRSRKQDAEQGDGMELSARVERSIEAEELYDFYQFSPVGYLAMDVKGRILKANVMACTMLEVPYSEIQDRPLFHFILWEDRDALYLHLRRLRKDQRPRSCELRMNSADGRIHHLRLESLYARNLEGHVPIRTVILDITDRKELEEDLRRSHDQLERRVKERTADLEKANKELASEIAKRRKFEADLKASSKKIIQQHEQRKHLARRLVDLLEKDRRDVAMTLHEDVGQVLVSIKMDLEAQLEANPALERVSMARDKTADLLRIIRNTSTELRPSPLESLGLIPSVRSLIRRTNEAVGFNIHLYTKGISKRLSPEKELALFRILQEALNNAAKHSGAGEIFVNLIRRNAEIVLTVEDDGKGFDYNLLSKMPQTKESPLGIVIMRERAAQFGGRFRIESQPGKGTEVTVEIPV
jgi:two-component system sensor histidine kinase DegS